MLNDNVICLLFLLQNYDNNSINPNLKQYKSCLKRYNVKNYFAYRATIVSYFSCLPEVCFGSSTFFPYS